jgi:DNA modification methylase
MEIVLNDIQHGDARELAKSIPDKSVDLIFTDPLYDRMEDYQWLAETACRILKPSAPIFIFYWEGLLPETLDALRRGGLQFRWNFSLYQPAGTSHAPNGFTQLTKCIWFDVNKTSKPYRQVPDIRTRRPAPEWFYKNYDPAKKRWFQDPNFISYYLNAFTNEGDLVVDFFAGSGTIPAVCKAMSRNFWACEIDGGSFEFAQERIERTLTPLALDGANAPDFQHEFPADVLDGDSVLPEPPRQ